MQTVSVTMNVTDEIVSLDSHQAILPCEEGVLCRPWPPKLPRLLTRCLPEPKPALAEIHDVPDFAGAPDTIRTCDLCLRRATLYPAELRVHWRSFSRLFRYRQCP